MHEAEIIQKSHDDKFRDEAALRVMQSSILAAGFTGKDHLPEKYALAAYLVADAMLKESKKWREVK